MNACATQLIAKLAAAGTWVDAPVLARGLPYPAEACDAELAGLLQAGDVEFNDRLHSWRLAGTPLARRALQQLTQQQGQGAPVRVLGLPDKGGKAYRFGVAVRAEEPNGLMRYSMAEVEIQTEPTAEAQLQHAQALGAWATAVANRAQAPSKT